MPICILLGFFIYYNVLNTDNEIIPEPTTEPTAISAAVPTVEPTTKPTAIPTAEPTYQPESDFSVSVDYYVNPIQISTSGIDIFIMATTSLPATSVTISALSDVSEYGAYNMYTGIDYWWFNANFYVKGTYTITVTAYSADGQTASDTFTYTY